MTSAEQDTTERQHVAGARPVRSRAATRVGVPAGSVARLARHAGGLRRLASASLDVRGALAAQLGLLDGPAVAVVGARAAGAEALKFSRRVAQGLAAKGRIVVSGGALGVDGAAHEGALDADGRTVAVLGTGVDVAYPERHEGLFARIALRGGLLSPFPLGTRAKAGHFPTRNPLVAALADAVVVVEAGTRSGSLGTAQAALRLGVPLYCRPGSPGCDALIAAGHAWPSFDAAELVARLIGAAHPVEQVALEGDDRRCFDALAALGLAPAESIAARLGISLGAALEALFSLEISRRAIRLEDGRYLAVQGSGDIKE